MYMVPTCTCGLMNYIPKYMFGGSFPSQAEWKQIIRNAVEVALKGRGANIYYLAI